VVRLVLSDLFAMTNCAFNKLVIALKQVGEVVFEVNNPEAIGASFVRAVGATLVAFVEVDDQHVSICADLFTFCALGCFQFWA